MARKTFHADVTAAATEVYGESLSVRFAIEPNLFQTARREQEQVKAAPVVVKPEETPKSDSQRRVRRWAKLSEFVVGPCNRVARCGSIERGGSTGRKCKSFSFSWTGWYW
jgi:chromosomal replication initiation ATPase DnaA